MPERDLKINGRTLIYKGKFDMKALFSTINAGFKEKGYDEIEIRQQEDTITPSGSKRYVELRATKKLSEYAKVSIKIRSTLDNVTQLVEQGNRYDLGDVEIIFDAWVVTYFEHDWNMKPWKWFFKEWLNKFLVKIPYDKSFAGIVRGDTGFIHAKTKDYFKLFSRPLTEMKSEADVRSLVAQEIAQQKKKDVFKE